MKTLLGLSRWCAMLLALAALVLAAQPAIAGTFTLSTTGGTWNTVYVQGFSPAVEPSPVPSASSGDTVYLDQFQFFKSGTADSAADVKLAIVNTMWFDYTNQLTTSSPELVGISTNTVASTAPLATGDAITFDFASLPLTYDANYAAVAVNDDGSGNLTPVLISALTEDYQEVEAGVWKPVPNYGGETSYDYATSNYIDAGYFSTFTYAGDAAFTATLHIVPEPASLLLVVGGAVLALVACRRRS